MKLRSSVILVVLITALSAASSAEAIDKCKAKVDKRTGVISIDATNAGGQVLWGATQGDETNAFFNEGSCNLGTKWKRCQIGDPATLASKTPPPACTVYLNDGVTPCAVWIGGCTPGPRDVDLDLQQVATDVTTLNDKTQCMTATATDTYITGCNLHVQSGAGATDAAVNGRGNLIVGYNEDLFNAKTGSHNLVVGRWHSYTSYAGLVAGENNAILGPHCSISGGRSSSTTGFAASITGGYLHLASGDFATVNGGASNTASGGFAVVGGGSGNIAAGGYSTVSGGDVRTAPGSHDWAAGSLLEDF